MKTESAYGSPTASALAAPAPATGLLRPPGAAPADAPFLLLDWGPVLLLHLAVAPPALAPAVPFPLDLLDGRAWVTLRLSTLTRLRVHTGGRWVDFPLPATRPPGVLTLAAAVRSDAAPGWCILDQWFSRELLRPVLRQTFGLPGRAAVFEHPALNGHGDAAGCISADGRSLAWSIHYRPQDPPGPPAGPRAVFLRERVHLFTLDAGLPRAFACTLLPPATLPAHVALFDPSLLARAPWWSAAALLTAELALAPSTTTLSRPRCLVGPACLTPWPELPTPSPF